MRSACNWGVLYFFLRRMPIILTRVWLGSCILNNSTVWRPLWTWTLVFPTSFQIVYEIVIIIIVCMHILGRWFDLDQGFTIHFDSNFATIDNNHYHHWFKINPWYTLIQTTFFSVLFLLALGMLLYFHGQIIVELSTYSLTSDLNNLIFAGSILASLSWVSQIISAWTDSEFPDSVFFYLNDKRNRSEFVLQVLATCRKLDLGSTYSVLLCLFDLN